MRSKSGRHSRTKQKALAQQAAAVAAATAAAAAAPAAAAPAEAAVPAASEASESPAAAVAVSEAPATPAVPEPEEEIVLQFGENSVTIADISEKVKQSYAQSSNQAAVTNVRIYIKPEDNKAYYVINNETEGAVDLY